MLQSVSMSSYCRVSSMNIRTTIAWTNVRTIEWTRGQSTNVRTISMDKCIDEFDKWTGYGQTYVFNEWAGAIRLLVSAPILRYFYLSTGWNRRRIEKSTRLTQTDHHYCHRLIPSKIIKIKNNPRPLVLGGRVGV